MGAKHTNSNCNNCNNSISQRLRKFRTIYDNTLHSIDSSDTDSYDIIQIWKMGGVRVQKLKPIYYKLSDGERKVNCYRINIAKSEAGEAGFDENTKIKIETEKDKIILKKGE